MEATIDPAGKILAVRLLLEMVDFMDHLHEEGKIDDGEYKVLAEKISSIGEIVNPD